MKTAAENEPPEIDVIIRTLAEKSRRAGLERALESIVAQAGVRARPLIVVNGQRYDDDVVAWLKTIPGAVYAYLPEGSLNGARLHGRAMVTAPFFTFLDDDDEFVTDSLAHPARWMLDHPDCDAAITAVHLVSGDGVVEHDETDRSRVRRAPVRALLDACWLHPGSGLFRTDKIGVDLLDLGRDYMEWTHLAFRLVVEDRRLHFMDVPTVLYNDTAGSMSKNLRHQENAVEVMTEIMTHPALDRATRRAARRKHAAVLHHLAAGYAREGAYARAWNRHLRSLRSGGWTRYLLFTRKLLPTPGRGGVFKA